jgi:hypothetical protein
MRAMGDVVFILLLVVMAAVVGVLFFGIFSMARGGEFNKRHGNRLMRLRVILQGAAVLLFLLFVLIEKG